MSMNPYLTQLLENCEPVRLQALAAWLEPELNVLPEESPQNTPEILSDPFTPEPFAEILKEEVLNMNNLSTIQTEKVQLADLVEFSMLHEFGANFAGKSCFQWLTQCVSRQFNQPELPAKA